MDRHLVLKRDDAQHSGAEFWQGCPKPKPIVFLKLGQNRLFYDTNTPLLLQVGPPPKYFGFKLLWRIGNISGVRSERNPGTATLTPPRGDVIPLPPASDRLLGSVIGRLTRGTTDRYLALEAAGLKQRSKALERS